MRRIMRHIVTIGPIGLLAVLVGCDTAVETPKSDDTPPDRPAPTFVGTWKTTSPAWRDDEIIGKRTTILTFTNSPRYIQYTLEEASDGTFIDDWAESGTWIATDSMITRTWVGWDDDNERWETETTSVAKRYTWTASGKVLFMERWGNEEETDSFARYTKVDIPNPYPISGSWKRVLYFDDSSRSRSGKRTQTFTFNDVFTFEEHETYENDEEPKTGILTGTWSIAPDNFILVIVESATGGSEGFGAHRFQKGQTLRLGYAPTDEIGKIQVSPYWREQLYDIDQAAWVDTTNLGRMYGNYFFQFTKEAAGSSN